MTCKTDDLKFMKVALKCSLKAKGFTEPNPMVGAVVVQDGEIISKGFHEHYGQCHAERLALGKITQPSSTLYLTLEPCTHFGNTPPCVDLVIEKKVKRVVIALKDPNPIVNGKGIEKLKQCGVEVTFL